MTFEDLGLGDKVLKAIADAGYTAPTPIQEKAIPQVLMGKDVLGIAQTGTGKTASFTLPMIEILSQGRAKARMPRSLIVSPTRELAAQIAENFEIYGKYDKLTMALLIGGVSFDEQFKKLDRGVDVLIATPGRLLDCFERGKILLSGIEIFVVDEADRMLDMGFIPDLERIFGMLPFSRQTLFFSATMPPEIQKITEKYLFSPARVEVARQATAAESITQEAIKCERTAKREVLRRLINDNDIKNAIIFCNRKRDVDVLGRSLKKHGFSADTLHGDMDQGSRTKTLERFKAGEIRLLVASDVAARGLDIPDVSHVFNFDVPTHPEDYVHRIGRTGRAGKLGHAYTIVCPDDRKYLKGVEELLGKSIKLVELDGLAAPEAGNEDAGETREESSSRGRGRRRGGRGRSRRGSDDQPQTAQDAPAVEEVEAKADAPETKSEDNSADADGEGRTRRRRGRRGGRGRRRSSDGQAEASANASDEKTEAKAEKPKRTAKADAEDKPAKPERTRRQTRGNQDQTRGKKEQPRGGRGRDRNNNGEPEKIKPRPDELPAFLLRPVE